MNTPYWARQILTMVGVLVTATYLAMIAWTLVVVGSFTIQPLWLAITSLFLLERVVTLSGTPWRRSHCSRRAALCCASSRATPDRTPEPDF